MSEKFQAFAYNSKTVWCSYIKFWQQFEATDLHVRIKFWGNWLSDFSFNTQKPPRKFGVKAVSFKNGLSTTKNISRGYMS